MPRVATCIFIDLETTGIPCQELNKTKITEISMVAVKSDHLLDTRPGATPRVQHKLTLCLNPRRMIQPGCTETTGLCNDLLEHETNFNLNVFNILNTFINVLTKPVCLIAHNGFGFDFPILKKHLEDLKVSFDEDLLCADSFFGLYDILEAKNKMNISAAKEIVTEGSSKKHGDETEDAKNKQDESGQNFTEKKEEQAKNTNLEQFEDLNNAKDFTSMQKINETTPKQQMIRPTVEMKQIRKVRKRFPWSEGEKPSDSYKLGRIYERLLNRHALNAHRAEADCLMLLESAVAVSKEFVTWIAENHKPFSEIKAMTIGVPLGQ